MRRNSPYRRTLAALAAFALLVATPAQIAAQSTSGGRAPSYAKLPASVVAQFKADPQSLLATYPQGGHALQTMARNLILSDPTLLGPLLSVAKAANSAQAAALGTGLAQAAHVLAVINPEMAAQIQLAVAQSGVAGIAGAFASVSNSSSASTSTSLTAAMGTASATPSSLAAPATPTGEIPAWPSSTSDPTTSLSSEPTIGSSVFTTAGGGTSSPTGGLTAAEIRSTSPSRSSL